jgi:hypothetical protein
MRRGLANLAANWELAALHWLQSTATAILFILGLIVPVAALGFHLLVSSWTGIDDIEGALSEVLLRLSDNVPLLALSLLGMLAVWTLAFLLYTYLQAGMYGILTEADRRVPPGVFSRPAYRAFSLSAFDGWARRHFWRFFWFLNLFGLFGSLIALAATLALAGMILTGAELGTPAILSAGCFGALVTLLAAFALAIWFLVAQADLAQGDAGVWEACRRGFSVLVRRLGAVLLLLLIFVAASVVISVLFLPLSFGAGLMGMGDPFFSLALQLSLSLLQTLPNALLAVALGGALVALVRSETQSEPEVLAA